MLSSRSDRPRAGSAVAGSGNSRRFHLLTALVAAFLLLPAAAASAEIDTHITIEGSGSGTVVGQEGANGGNPPIECEWNGETEEQTGTCDTEAAEVESFSFFAIYVIPKPAYGSKFTGWKREEGFLIGGCEKIGDCAVATFPGGKIKIKATFEAIPRYALTLKKTGTGDGTVTSDKGIPAPIDCEPGCEEETVEALEGEKVTLEASPDGSSAFAGWSGCESEPEGKCKVTMSAAKEVEAEFSTIDTHVIVEGEGSGAVVPYTGEEGLAGNPPVECDWNGETEEQTGACDTETIDLLGSPGVKVAYEADPGSAFAGWEVESGTTVECEELGEFCAVEKSGAEIKIKASFVLIPKFALNLSTSGSGSGSFKCDTGSGPEACQPEYGEGTEVKVVPVPDIGSEFVEWTGDCSGSDPEGCSVTMDEEHSVGAVVGSTLIYALNLSTSGGSSAYFECDAGSGRMACALEYLQGVVVKVIPVAEPGSEFVEWTGDCSGSDPEGCSVTMDAEHSVGAALISTFPLNASTSGTGSGSFECDTGSGPEACQPEYGEGTEVKVVPVPDIGSEFVEWTGDCSGSDPEGCSVTMDEEHELGAVLDLIDRGLTIEKGGSGSGGVQCDSGGGPKPCAATYPDGTAVTIIATPGVGSKFAEWSGECDNVAGNKCEVEMDEDKAVEVVFDLLARTLTINKTGTGSGSVSCDGGACAASYPHGTEVTLVASAASGSTFAGWSGGGCSGAGNCVATLDADTTVTATFNANPPEETCATNPALCPPEEAGTAKAAATAQVSGSKAALKLTCTGGGACKGSFELTAKVKQGEKKKKNKVIGKASFSIAAGKSKTIELTIANGQVEKELKHGRTVKAKLGGSGIESRTVRLKPLRARRSTSAIPTTGGSR